MDYICKGCAQEISTLVLVIVPVAVARYPGNVQGIALTLCSFCSLHRDLLCAGLTTQPHIFKINTLCGLLLLGMVC